MTEDTYSTADRHEISSDTIEEINKGSEQAFAQLYKDSYSYLMSVAIYHLYDHNESAKVVDDVFLRLWQLRGTLSYPIMPYLLRAVRNRCLNHIKQQVCLNQLHDKQKRLLQESVEELFHSEHAPFQYVEAIERQAEITRAIETLPPKMQQVMALHYQGCSTQEIAEAMGTSPKTVRAQLYTAYDKLKPLLKHLLSTLLFLFN
ncbi:MAG: RNA polymerase sigma factor [Prevotella sp.]